MSGVSGSIATTRHRKRPERISPGAQGGSSYWSAGTEPIGTGYTSGCGERPGATHVKI
jgi:hypothetical protein